MDTRRATSKSIPILTAKMTPEMCRAIRRQESNSGLGYWKSGFSNSNITENTSGVQDKKPTYRGVTQVNFDFPGLFLPNVGTQPLKPKRKDPKGQSIVLNRTKSSLGPDIRIGRSSDARTKTDNHDQSKKSTISDLTCLQLADTLLSYNKNPLTGVYGTSTFGLYSSPLASRYADLFSGNKSNDNRTNDEQHGKSNKDSDINSTIGDKKFPILMYHTFQPEDNDMLAERHGESISPTSDPHVVNVDVNSKPQSKPQKSILKNGLSHKTSRPSSETAISYKYTTLEKPNASSYHLPGAKAHLRSISETRLPTTTIYPKIQNDMKDTGQHRGLKSIPVKHESTCAIRNIPVRLEREHTSFGEYRGLETRKRSVRFNAAHEVREYTPCEPTSFC